MFDNDLPVHPRTGLRAIGIGRRGPIWPVMGGSGEGGAGGGQGDPATGSADGGAGDTKSTETVEFWKQKAGEHEKAAKDNAAAAKELARLQEVNKSDAEKSADRLAKAEAEVAAVPAKVAEALKAHLVTLHKVDTEDADLFLTATDPELLLKQVDRLIGQRKRKSNYVAGVGNTKDSGGGDGLDRQFVRNLFGTNN